MSIVAAVALNNVIGAGNKLPWYLPKDLNYFKQKTIDNIVVMGRKTYNSVGKPLSRRINVVFTSTKEIKNVVTVANVDAFFRLLQDNSTVWQDKEVFIIGGAEIFRLLLPYTSTLYLTQIKHNIEGDTYFPKIDTDEWKIVSRRQGERDEDNDYDYEFIVMERKG